MHELGACMTMKEQREQQTGQTVWNSEWLYQLLCRVRDVVLAALLLVAFAPFLLVVGLLIVLDSPGAGPIFAQTRVGLDGKRFILYKLRTMHPGAEAELGTLLPYNEMDGPVFKLRNDPRVTRLGRFLRRACIDELPQLWNVLRGDMSLVGPRPAPPREVEQYDAYTRQRLAVLPGLTCYWQVQPCRNQTSFREWVELDLRYIRERTFLGDLAILGKTVLAVMRMDGQ